MFFGLLKLLGLDVPAKMAQLQAEFETKAYEAEHHFIEVARDLALMTGLLVAGLLLGVAGFLVLLAAVFVWVDFYEGPIVALATNAGILMVAAAILIALGMNSRAARSRSEGSHRASQNEKMADSRQPVEPDRAEPARTTPNAEAGPTPQPQSPPDGSNDLVEPLLALIAQYVKIPATGHADLDRLLREISASAEGTSSEAIARAANLVRTGDRTTFYTVMAVCVLFGWMLVRSEAVSSRSAV